MIETILFQPAAPELSTKIYLRIPCVEYKCNCDSQKSQKSFGLFWRNFFPTLSRFADENSEARIQVRLFDMVDGKKVEKQFTEKMPDMLEKLFSEIDNGLEHNNSSHGVLLQVIFLYT